MSGDDRVRRALRARRARFVSGLRLFREHVRALCHLRPESRRRGCPSPRPRAAILVTYGDLTVAQRIGYATELNGHGDDMPTIVSRRRHMITTNRLRRANGAADTWTRNSARAQRGDNTWG